MLTIPAYRILKVEPRSEKKLIQIRCQPIAGGAGGPGGTGVFRLYPGGKEILVKSVDGGTDAVRLTVKGVPRSGLPIGGLIIGTEWPVAEERECLFLHDGGSVPGESESVRGGLSPDFNRERLVGRAVFRREGSFLAARFPQPYPMLPGMACSILGENGAPRRLTLLWPGYPAPDELRRLNGMAPRRPDPHPGEGEIYGRILHIRGAVRMPPYQLAQDWKDASRAGDWMILDARRRTLEKRILKLCARPGGADEKILRLDDAPSLLLRVLADAMVSSGELIARRGWFFPPGPPPLSPFHRNWLERIESAGEEGLRDSVIKGNADREAVEALGRSGLVRGGRDLWIGETAFTILADRLLEGVSPGDRIDMAEARDKLGGNRVRTIEVLAEMEADDRLSVPGPGGERVVL